MAPIPASITVNFISNYAGDHRVCWRIGNSGPYDCSTIVACAGGGSPCNAVIAITVDNETCDPVTFEGYVQATCEDIGSLNGRISFSVEFVPDQPCDMYTVTCAGVPLAAITVTNAGEGYTPGSDPAVAISGGGGSAAAANAIIGDGGVKAVTINNGGAGYLGGGSGNVLAVPAVNLVGTGVGATFDVEVTLGVITDVTLSGPTFTGTGYAVTDTFEFNNASFGGSGAGVIVEVTAINTGEVAYVDLTAGGSGYSSDPTITIPDPPAGVTAAAIPQLGICPALNLGDDCAGDPIPILPGIGLNESVYKCGLTAPAPAAGYVVTEEGCCYDCVFATFTNADGSATLTVRYLDCTTRELVETTVLFGAPLNVCVVNNSWWLSDTTIGSVSTVPTCP